MKSSAVTGTVQPALREQMLQQLNEFRGTQYDPAYGAGDGAAPQELLSSAFGLLIRQFPVILSVTLLFLTAGAAFVVWTPPRYTARAILAVEGQRSPMLPPGEADRDVAGDTHVEMLESDQVAQNIIHTLGLVQHPEFAAPSHDIVSIVSNLQGYLSDLFKAQPEDPTGNALGVFRRQLTVKRVGSRTYEIAFRSLDPERAALVANAVVDAYNAAQRDAARSSARSSGNWLQQRLADLRDDVERAERAINDFKAKNNIIETDGRLIGDQQLKEANSQLLAARTQREDATARLNLLQQVLASGGGEFRVPETLRSEVLIRLRQQLVTLTSRERDYAARFGAGHGAVTNLRNEIRETRRAMMDELKRIADGYAADLDVARAREEAIRASLSQAIDRSQSTSTAQIELRELESNLKTYRALYDTFLQRHAEALQQESLPRTLARAVSNAVPPLSSSFPNVPLVLALSLVGGLSCGAGLGFVRELMDRAVRSPDQLEALWGRECLAVLPLFKELKEVTLADTTHSEVGQLSPTRSILNYVLDEPFSRYSEGIRSIKLAIDLASDRTSSVVGITSALPNEGKSTVAANLARLIAQTGRRTLLVDLDLRNPSLTRSLAPDATEGLIELLSETTDFGKAIKLDPSKLEFLPAVLKVRLPHTNEIVASRAMADLISRLRSTYDYIIIDLPPLAPIVDTRSALRLVDSLIFVVEWGTTKVNVITHALKRTRLTDDQLLGMVLNKVDMAVLGRIEHYGGRYYTNDQYYSRYGYTSKS